MRVIIQCVNKCAISQCRILFINANFYDSISETALRVDVDVILSVHSCIAVRLRVCVWFHAYAKKA